MRYFKLIYFTNGDEYNTHEMLLDEERFRKCQKALADGADLLPLEDRVIRRAMIKEIAPADDIIEEYARQGITPKQLGLPELPALPEEKKEIEGGIKKLYGI